MTTTNVYKQMTKPVIQVAKNAAQITEHFIQISKPIIPQDVTCYKCSGVAMRREIDNKGNRTGRYLCLSCYGQFYHN